MAGTGIDHEPMGSIKHSDMKVAVMDVYPESNTTSASASHCCRSSLKDALFKPDEEADYACRWVHLSDNYQDFQEFMEIAHNLLLHYPDTEREEILAGLRRFQRQHEIKGFHGPSFDPKLVSLSSTNKDEAGLGFLAKPQREMPESDLPAFASMPSVNLLQNVSQNGHRLKSLLQYHYRFGRDKFEPHDQDPSRKTTLLPIAQNSVVIGQIWCLAVDRRNLLTASILKPDAVWPLACRERAKFAGKRWPQSLIFAFDHCLWDDTSPDMNAILLSLHPESSWKCIPLLISTMLRGFAASMIPGGWAVAKAIGYIERWVYGYTSLGMAGMRSALYLFSGLPEDYGDGAFSGSFILKLSGLILLPSLRSISTCGLQLPHLKDYTKRWAEIELELRAQENPPEDILDSLRELWTIAIIFRMNFVKPNKSAIYQLDHVSLWTKIFMAVWMKVTKKQWGRTDARTVKLRHLPRKFSSFGRTLDALEKRFISAQEVLEERLRLAGLGKQGRKERENEEFLQNIRSFGSSPSLACLHRMCTLSSPTRISTTSRYISEMYTNKISRLEWLIRDAATQPLVYEISAVADELRILKDILRSQIDIISSAAEILVRQIGNPSLFIGDSGECAADSLGTPSTPDTNSSPDNIDKKRVQTLEALHRIARRRQEPLTNSIERMEETLTRLQAQAALFINIRAEDKNVAVFVFTIVTVIFLPLSFASSYFGMNTKDIRDIDHGQWIFWAVGGSLTVVVLLTAWLIASRGPRLKNKLQARSLMDIEDWKWGEFKRD